MKLSIIKKLNKTYSVVIIPNSNDSIKKFSLKAPFIKILLTLLLILTLALSLTLLLNSSNDNDLDTKAEVGTQALQQQIQDLSQIITKQNSTLELSKSRVKELEANDKATKDKINEFTKMYTKIANNYISKSSRGSTTKSITNTSLDMLALSKIVEELNKTVTVDEEISSQLEITDKTLNKFVAALPTLIPASGKITSPFGMRNHPITKVNKAHQGVDIDAQKGDSILAAGSGVVEYSGYSNGYGYNVIIDHKNGFRTIYGHCSKLLVKKGEAVKRGQIIALVGSTGVSTGPHLHFEIRLANTPVDPTKYVDF